MGTLRLNCPLCCTETFSSHKSLKYHLLSISDNLICPSCNKRFDNILDLAMHIGRECGDVEIEDVPDTPSTFIKVEEIYENVLEPEDPDLNESNTELVDKQVEDSEDLYFCSSCDINFASVEDHLNEFHQGHEVMIEECNELENSAESSSAHKVYQTEDNDTSDSELNNTVKKVDCVDNSGLVYTRNFVKIDKFWDKEEENQDSESRTPKVDDVNVGVVTASEEASLIDLYQCTKCHTTFGTMDCYLKHQCGKEDLDSGKYTKCKYCKAYFDNGKALVEHCKLHIRPSVNTPPFLCEICNTLFPAYKSLRLHKRMHDPIKAKDIEPPVNYGLRGETLHEEGNRELFVCKICNKIYDKKYEEPHMKFHNSDSDFTCDICNRKFFTQKNLNMHMRAHTDTKKFVCSHCKKGYLTKEKLDAHLETKCQSRQYECQYCGRRFAKPHEKVKHERIHTGEKPHVCEICGKAFRVSYCLTLHMRTHSGMRPYKCDHCGKRFKAHSVYNHHLLTHSEDRKYKCPFCPKTFKTGVQLAGHKNSHTKPFTCTECNRPFASLYAVRAHMETHQRQNNLKYKCWLCGASYARAFALRDHLRDVHKDKSSIDATSQIAIINSNEYQISESTIIIASEESILMDINNTNVDNIEIPASLEGDASEAT